MQGSALGTSCYPMRPARMRWFSAVFFHHDTGTKLNRHLNPHILSYYNLLGFGDWLAIHNALWSIELGTATNHLNQRWISTNSTNRISAWFERRKTPHLESGRHGDWTTRWCWSREDDGGANDCHEGRKEFFKVYQSRSGIDTNLRSDIHRYLMFVGSVCFLFGFMESRSITLDSWG